VARRPLASLGAHRHWPAGGGEGVRAARQGVLTTMANPESPEVGPVDYLRALKRSHQGGSGTSASIPMSAGTTGLNAAAAPAVERRRAPRYKSGGSVEFRSEGSDFRTWATLTDISRTGCYVEMQATSPPDTAVDIVIDILGIQVRTRGTVRVTYPFLGMGIAFTDMSLEDRARLDDILRRLEGSLSPAPPPRPAEPPAFPSQILTISDPGAALNGLLQFFQGNGLLSRDEFLELIRKSQPR